MSYPEASAVPRHTTKFSLHNITRREGVKEFRANNKAKSAPLESLLLRANNGASPAVLYMQCGILRNIRRSRSIDPKINCLNGSKVLIQLPDLMVQVKRKKLKGKVHTVELDIFLLI